MRKPHRMPVPFIDHGSPMNTLAQNDYTRAWASLGRALPRPRAVLAISARWQVGTTAVTAMVRPRMIHDFRGFPPALSQFDYPAPGLPELAGEIAELVNPTGVEADQGRWSLDHGTWSVLAHLYPQADVPMVQLSINSRQPMADHLALGAKLSALRDRGVLIPSSGNVVHNLRRVQWTDDASAFDWNVRFDEAAEGQLTDDPASILRTIEHPDHAEAGPTPDHFIPLLYTAGLAAQGGPAKVLVRGHEMGALSMTCCGVGIES
jgi:4,5-DOPA dioxygenase extradiol